MKSLLGGLLILGVASSPIARSSESAPVADARAGGASGPVTLQPVARFAAMPKPIVLPDGTWAAYFLEHEGPGLPDTPARQTVSVKVSRDRGSSWSAPEVAFALPSESGGFGYFVPLLDKEGEVHLFILCDANTGAVRARPPESGLPPAEPLQRQRLDVWHAKSTHRRTKWTPAKPIWEGRAGDLQSVTQLANGRIVLPLSYLVDRSWGNRGAGTDAFTYKGQFDTTVLISDDGGETWRKSSSVLNTSTPDLSAYGAIEPVVLQLNDGRVWMLLRTQHGRFYESFSPDGETWSPAAPSTIKSSDSPAALARLPDGRVLMLWNNCQRHPYAQGSRHVLHAAVSRDDGRTWSGFREIVRDPCRDTPPPPSGDHGVSYPYLAAGANGDVIFSLWVETGTGRSLWTLDPAWLEERHTRSTFDHLDAWSTFGTAGVSTQPHPDGGNSRVLVLEDPGGSEAAAAVWNFPMGVSGTVRARIRLDGGAAVEFQLTDHFSPPFDEQSHLYSLFNLGLKGESAPNASETPAAKEWLDVEICWDCTRGSCSLLVNGVKRQDAHQQHASVGPSYLRIRPMRDARRPAGRITVEKVEVSVSSDAQPAGSGGERGSHGRP